MRTPLDHGAEHMTLKSEHVPDDTPWHAGELALQQSAGVAEQMDGVGRRVLHDYLTEQHRLFYPLLPFVAVGAVDKHGDVWATLKTGRPGFLSAPDAHTLSASIDRDAQDPADSGLGDGDAVAMLGIELHTRRRNRLNGTIRRHAPDRFDVTVRQAYGNCPQYIQLRDYEFVRDPEINTTTPAEALVGLDKRAKDVIRNADTFFVATYIDTPGTGRQVDVSHRGGKSGFVRLNQDNTLTVPDFAGNLFFNTLGNIAINGHAGLVFIDFTSGELLQLTGEAKVILDSEEIQTFQGAERLWTFKPRKIIRRPDGVPLRWRMQNKPWSPNVFLTGSWEESEQRLSARSMAATWRTYRVEDIVDESTTIRSFHLYPTDGMGKPPHAAGQHLAIRLTLPGNTHPIIRNYTLSTAPSDDFLRISVKREGLLSTHLHHAIQRGATIDARGPSGAFSIDASEMRPAVMLAAGIGITPLLSMLRHLFYEGNRTRRTRPTWLFHSARTRAERAFDLEIANLVETANGAVRWIRILSDPADAAAETEFDHAGRIDMALLRKTLPFDDFDFYICGPAAFMQSVYDGLVGMSVPDERIHAETFGPSGIVRQSAREAAFSISPPPADEPVEVRFNDASAKAVWRPDTGTLLDCAEAAGLSPPFDCRTGTCGTCRATVASGAVTHIRHITAPLNDGEVLLCSAVPAKASASLKLTF